MAYFIEKMKKIASVLAQCKLQRSAKRRGPSLVMESKNMSNLKGMLSLELMVVLNERQKQKRTFDRELKAA